MGKWFTLLPCAMCIAAHVVGVADGSWERRTCSLPMLTAGRAGAAEPCAIAYDRARAGATKRDKTSKPGKRQSGSKQEDSREQRTGRKKARKKHRKDEKRRQKKPSRKGTQQKKKGRARELAWDTPPDS